MIARRRWQVAIACAALAACGSAGSTRQPRNRRSGISATGACSRQVQLSPGEKIAGWRLGAVHFVSPRVGIGITAAGLPCYVPVRSGGTQVTWEQGPVWLTVSRDGGRDWIVTGRPLPVAPARAGPAGEQIAASSVADVWAVSATGQVFASSNGGAGWTLQPLPGPVVQLTLRSRSLWALACPPITGELCRPVLERSEPPRGAWTRIGLPQLRAGPNPQLAIASNRVLVLEVSRYAVRPAELLVSVDAGRQWTQRPAPAWDGNGCTWVAALTAASARDWWLLCLGGAAAGSSTKGLVRTTDGGRTWATVSAVRSLTQIPSPGSISAGEPNALTAGSPTRLWLALENGFSESADGGATWSDVPGINPEGLPAFFDVRSPVSAWLIVPGGGLWRTTDGSHWQALGPLNGALFS